MVTPSFAVALAGGIDQQAFPCWARTATGIVLALIAWVGFLGVRSAVRQYRDGRVRTANVTGALSVVGVLVAIGVFWAALQAAF